MQTDIMVWYCHGSSFHLNSNSRTNKYINKQIIDKCLKKLTANMLRKYPQMFYEISDKCFMKLAIKIIIN